MERVGRTAWVAVDYSGEFISDKEPFKDMFNIGYYGFVSDANVVKLSEGTIKKLIGRDLTWEDGPIKLKEGKHEECTRKP